MYKHFKLDSPFLAKVISLISNPFLVIIFAIIIGDAEYIFLDPGEIITFMSVGLFLPLSVYVYQILKHKKHILHYVSLNQTSRTPVYLISIYSAFFNIIVFSYLRLSFWMFQGILMFVFFSVMYLINRYVDKASMHAAGFAFGTFYLIDKASTWFILLLLLLPLIFWARIKLHKHTVFQLYLGTMVGLVIGLISWLR